MSELTIKVNGEVIPQAAVDFELQRLIHFYQQHGVPEAQIQQQLGILKERAQEQAIGTKLLLDEVKKLDIKVTAEELDAEYQTLLAKVDGGEEKLAEMLKPQGRTVEQLKEEMAQGVKINKLLEKICADAPMPTETEIEEHYEAHKAEYTTQGQVLAQHILVKPESDSAEHKDAAKAKLQEIRARIVSGESTFGDEAEKHSDCPSGKSGGSLGWFGRGMMVKPFEEAAFTLPVNEVSDLIETQFGYHIIVKTDEKPAQEPTLDELHDQIRDFLMHDKRGNIVGAFVADLRAKADVVIG